MDDDFLFNPDNEHLFYNAETSTYYFPKNWRQEVIKRCKLILEHGELYESGICSFLVFNSPVFISREIAYKFPYYFRLDTWGVQCLIDNSEHYQGPYFGKDFVMNPLRNHLLEFIIRICSSDGEFNDFIRFCKFYCHTDYEVGTFPCVFQKDYPQ
jgi:hypothetical protein